MCLGAGLLAGAGGGAAAGTAAATGFGAAATGSALGFSSAGLAGLGATTAAFAPIAAAAPAISFGTALGAASTGALGFGSLGAGLLSASTLGAFTPAVTGATGLFGLGAATKPFLLGQALNLGTNIFSTISQRNQIFRQVQGIYDSSLQLIANAEKAKADQERAINQLLDDKVKSKKQEILTVKVKTLKAKEALVASERAGNTMSLLLQDFENQGANATESILQESDTLVSQALRDKNAVIATRDTRRNAAKDQITKATNLANSAPTLLGAITKTLGSGLSSYTQLVAA